MNPTTISQLDPTQWVQMLIEANHHFGATISDYFYIQEDELELFKSMGEVVEFGGMLFKLGTMRRVKLYNPTTKTFR